MRVDPRDQARFRHVGLHDKPLDHRLQPLGLKIPIGPLEAARADHPNRAVREQVADVQVAPEDEADRGRRLLPDHDIRELLPADLGGELLPLIADCIRDAPGGMP